MPYGRSSPYKSNAESDRFAWPEPTIKARDRTPRPTFALACGGGQLAFAGRARPRPGDESYVWPTLCRVASGVLGAQHPDLDDAVQQSMLALLRALPAFRGECHPAGYASRITLRVALRVRRGHKRDLTRREAFTQLNVVDETSASPTEDALSARRRELLRELLQDLPEEQAEALALRVVMGWTLDEVSRATGAPINTVRSRVRLAKEALRKRIESAPELGELKEQP
jgi:RNA polymerase sigma factor (sigma-70 family)